MSTETIEEWAARVAPAKTTEEWRIIGLWCASFVGDKLAETKRAGCPTKAHARALLAHRDKVAADVASLSRGGARLCLRKSCAGPVKRCNEGNRRMLEVRGLVDGLVATPFGREIDRVLGEP